ncbi:MAG: DNA repair protein RecN [Propionibacteriales bacterium]|nr:DNA repair protein RecN [Propionibacteriales bacterium]
MLEELRLTGLGVIDEAVLEFGPGFTAVTGETGAGKTMVVTALGLLLGARADSQLVRSGATKARIEGRVGFAGSAELKSLLADLDADVDESSLILTRVLSAEGRSRALVGGASVPVSRLSAVADSLVAVHGQSDQHRLLRPGRQREALDGYAGAGVREPLTEYRELYSRLRAAEAELAEVTASMRERAREADMLRIGLAEVEEVAPQPGEDRELLAEEGRLAHADALRTSAQEAGLALTGDEQLMGSDALARLEDARKALDSVRDHDPDAARLADRVAEVTYLVADLGSDVASYASAIDSDPARLAWVQERRAALGGLRRKYGDTIDDVLQWAADGAERLLDLDGTDQRIEELEARVAELRDRLAVVAAELTAARTAAAERLAEEATGELGDLAMPHARLEVRVTQRPDETGLRVGDAMLAFGPNGVDQVAILLAANSESEPLPLDRGASGGEMSRVMLALEVTLAGRNPVPTLVFDEVDAGVAGRAAVEIGRRLARLARDSQVLVVTHLPQVAAFADRHFAVVKSDDGTVSTSGLHPLDRPGRIAELSRMLAGLDDSETAHAHAEELLALAEQETADGKAGNPAPANGRADNHETAAGRADHPPPADRRRSRTRRST